MTCYVEVAVNVPQAMGLFHYHLPASLVDKAQPGCLVVVPFGSQKVQGIILRTVEEPEVPSTRPVHELLDPLPVLTGPQIALAQWMSGETLSPLASCLDRFLPPGLSKQADILYTLDEDALHRLTIAPSAPKGLQIPLINLLRRRGPLRGRQIDRALPHQPWRGAAQVMVRWGWLKTQNLLASPTVQAKFIRTAQLGCPLEAAQAALSTLGKPSTAAYQRRKAALEFFMREPWAIDVTWAYAQTGCILADLEWLAERGLVTLSETEVWRDPLSNVIQPPDEPPALTQDQDKAWERLQAAFQQLETQAPSHPVILHGVTGSGKTEIYLCAVEACLKLGRQAIIMVPEIALTPQTVRRFMARFPGQVGLVHSRLSPGERYDTWRRARLGSLPVIVGPRSALFTPLPHLGLIIVDEAHDESYYQSEIPPNYHAARLAVQYARLAGALCVLGSATPDVVTLYQAEQAKWPVLSLPARVLAHRQVIAAQAERLGIAPPPNPVEGEATSLELPPIRIVDMRQELKAGNRSIFSRALQEALGQVIAAGQQAILFLNRRGTATYIFCRNCGHSLNCPQCDLPLTYHSPSTLLTCHYCGYQLPLPITCPVCGSNQIRQYGTGTEKVEAEIQALSPGVRTLRWDAETTREKGAHEIILSHFANHRADVLIGTQMLAKGLDLPFVTLVGAILADVGLSLPDYRAAERTFQVLTQVAGRAGRSPLGGQVILQTFQPDHYVIQAASHHDFAAFYRQELVHRRELGYPPFYRLVRLEYRHPRSEKAEETAHNLANQIREWIAAYDRRATDLIGPVPCFFSRISGLYRWQIVLRGPDPASLLRGRSLGEWRVEVDPPNLL
jgi:primosomal protein N' (replication factor Y)